MKERNAKEGREKFPSAAPDERRRGTGFAEYLITEAFRKKRRRRIGKEEEGGQRGVAFIENKEMRYFRSE